MTRSAIIQEIKANNYFKIQELVCKHTYDRFGDSAWRFFNTELLHTLLIIRKNINKSITVNNWSGGGSFSQRGLRCNICQLVKDKTNANRNYMTAHGNGAGVDFDVKGMTAQQVRDWIAKNEILLPYPIWIESGVTWVHVDTYDLMNGKKINYFSE